MSMYYNAIPILFQFAKQLRANETDAEKLLWNYLKTINIPKIRFRRQHPILFFIADFYCHKAKLVIELDGNHHNLPIQYLYDQNRDSELKELGLKVIRFTNEEIFHKIEDVLIKIELEIKSRIL